MLIYRLLGFKSDRDDLIHRFEKNRIYERWKVCFLTSDTSFASTCV